MRLRDWFTLYVFTSGRAMFALRATKALTDDGAPEFVRARVHSALGQAEQTRAAERAYVQGRAQGSDRADAPIKDAVVDRLVGGLFGALTRMSARLTNPARRAQAQALLLALFPNGAEAITGLLYEEAVEAVRDLLAAVHGPHAQAIADLGLTIWVEDLEPAFAEFEAAVKPVSQKHVTFDQVRAARERMQDALVEVLAAILGHAADAEQRQAAFAWLGPIAEQQERIGEAYRQRSATTDVDPETGAEIEPLVPESE